ncbi:MAG: VWA domain-containing protein [Acidobacteria bacterium]|nr:VWA domain-containing protein [Acidobacteriota bacterium]
MTLSVSAAAAAAQKRGSESGAAGEPESGPEFTIKVPVNVVPVSVTVTDKAGRPVKDLTAADFKLFEDGKPQRIQSFEIESSQPLAGPGPEDDAGAAAAETGALQPLQGSEGEPGKLISFFIDDLTEQSPEFFGWTISALKTFVAEEMRPKDRVGVFSASGRVTIPFSGNQEFLRGEIQELNVGKLDLARPYRGRQAIGPNQVSLTDLQAIRIVEGGHVGGVDLRIRARAYRQYEETQAAVHRLLAGLAIHLRQLQNFTIGKALVLLSEGFVVGRRMRWRLDQVVNQALKSGVSFNAVDIRGLNTFGYEASSYEPPVDPRFVAGRNIGRTLSARHLDQVYQSRPLEKLTEETGGTYFRDSNDLVAGFRQIRDAQSFYYVLSYASPDQKAGGKYHRIRVEVARPGLELSYRRGYFAPREELSQEERKNEDFQLALEAPGRFDRIPLELGFRSSPLEGDRHRLSVFTKVNVAAIPFQHQEGRWTNLLNLVVAVYDEKGSHVDGSEQKVELSLSESSYRSMLQRGFMAKTEVEIPAGRYTVKAVVRESNQARMGSLQQAFGIPVPEAGADGRDVAAASPAGPIPAASLESGPLVLSQRLIPLADLSALQQESLLASDAPLIFRDVQVLPLKAGLIDRRQPVTFYYRLHNLQHPLESREMTARVQLTDESGRVSRFPLISLGEGMTQSWGEGRVAVVFNLSFKSVQPGKYRLTVMTRAPAAGGQSVIARSAMTVAD